MTSVKKKKAVTANQATGLQKLAINFKKYWQIYLLLLPALVWYILFAYYPMAGLQLAFKTYKAKIGIWGSPWCGFQNFQAVFRDMYFWRSIGRTLVINFGRLIINFPAPILLALMLNELRVGRYKKIMQTVFTFPHFLSWVIVASIMTNLLSVDGLVNTALKAVGASSINFLGSEKMFQPMLYITDIWNADAVYVQLHDR